MAFVNTFGLPCPSRAPDTKTCRRTRNATTVCCVDTAAKSASKPKQTTSDPFGTDGGRDLFFTGMVESLAISMLDVKYSDLKTPDDRYIAVERLKYYNSAESTWALLSFIQRLNNPDELPVEERAARRKAVECLGRHKGAHHEAAVRKLLVGLLSDSDTAAVENAVWALAQIPGELPDDARDALVALLDGAGDGTTARAPHRAVLHTITEKKCTGALYAVLRYSDTGGDDAARSAAAAARAVLGGDMEAMRDVVPLLKVRDLNTRRAALHDIRAARYTEAVRDVAEAPLSLVLRLDCVHQLINGRENELNDDDVRLIDRLIWDYPNDLDLLEVVKSTPRQRAVTRNVRALYRNDALDAYVATRTLAEDGDENAGDETLRSYTDRGYFDYFGSYHAFKTLGWLTYKPAWDTLVEAAMELPPRYYNHRIGALTALVNLYRNSNNADGTWKDTMVNVLAKAACDKLWQVRLGAVVAARRCEIRIPAPLQDDGDVMVRNMARSLVGADHLRDSF